MERGLDKVKWNLICLPDFEVVVDLQAVPVDARYEKAYRAFGFYTSFVVCSFVGGFFGVSWRWVVGGAVVVVLEVVVPPWWLDRALLDVSSEDARDLQLRIVVFANGSAYLHCSSGKDLYLWVQIFFVAEEGGEEPIRVVHVVS